MKSAPGVGGDQGVFELADAADFYFSHSLL